MLGVLELARILLGSQDGFQQQDYSTLLEKESLIDKVVAETKEDKIAEKIVEDLDEKATNSSDVTKRKKVVRHKILLLAYAR